MRSASVTIKSSRSPKIKFAPSQKRKYVNLNDFMTIMFHVKRETGEDQETETSRRFRTSRPIRKERCGATHLLELLRAESSRILTCLGCRISSNRREAPHPIFVWTDGKPETCVRFQIRFFSYSPPCFYLRTHVATPRFVTSLPWRKS